MSKKVREAKKASPADLSLSVPHVQALRGLDFHFVVAGAVDLSEETRRMIWNIFQENMHSMYLNSSMGWHPPQKRREMFNSKSRYILVYPLANANELVAYTMFRFEEEDNLDVVYCYELQILKTVHRQGLGKSLMQNLYAIGTRWGMQRVMLTVFKENTAAREFYKALDFTQHKYSSDDSEESDSGTEEEPVDYEIMSRAIPLA